MTVPRFDDSPAALLEAIAGSVLWTRIKRGGMDDDRRRLDDELRRVDADEGAHKK